ncbi:MAG TPA: AMP-binding protein [Conexibacter sp.]|nr:AMP-binding protein [Conexibacter sp.]
MSRSARLAEARSVAELAVPALRALAGAGVLKPLPPARALQALSAARALGLGAAAGCAISAARDPHCPAVIDERGSITFAELNDRAERIAAALRTEHGIGPDRSLAVMCRNHRGFVEAMLTASRLGADLLLLNTDFPGPQLAQALAPHQPGAIVHDEEFGPALDGALADAAASRASVLPEAGSASAEQDASGTQPARILAWHDAQPATGVATLDRLAEAGHSAPKPPAPPTPGRLVILSSGTTGAPKGAAREPSPSAVLGPLTTLLEELKPHAGDPIVIGPPVFHGFGLAFLGLALFVGAPVVLRRRFDAQWALEAIERHHATHLVGVPAMLQRILALPAAERARPNTTSLRAVASAGAPLAPDVASAFMDAFGDHLFNLYGSTETGFASCAGPADMRAAPGTVGRAPRGVTIAVLDEQRRPVPPGTIGTVFIGSGLVFDGYSGGGSREVVGGLMNIGDVGHLDPTGRLFIDGREDDMILSGGENVYPQEVEDLLIGHPLLVDAAVIGVEDPDFGQRLRAFAVRRSDDDAEPVTEEQLIAWLRERLARYKLPREVIFLDAIPRNPTGKVLKRELPATI